MGKPREWKLVEGEDNKRHLQDLTELDKSYLSKFGVLAACNSIHVREVSPSRDALFDEMLGALKSIKEWKFNFNGPVESFEEWEPIQKIIDKAEGKE